MTDTRYHLFVDDSGSTSGVASYWEMVSKVYDTFKAEIVEIIMWGNSVSEIYPDVLSSYVKDKRGRDGGTNPACVASCILSKKITKNIILITDGQVGNSQIEKTDKILLKHNIDNVFCYIIGDQSQMNMSVTCPFTRGNTSKVFVNDTLHMSHQKSDYEMLKTIDTISYEDFVSRYDELESMLIAANMGRQGDIEMHSRLVQLKKSLLQSVAKIMQADDSTKSNVTSLIDAVRSGNNFLAIEFARNIHNEYFHSDEGNLATQFDKKINYLISLCGDLRGMYTVDQIRGSKMARAPTLHDVEPSAGESADNVPENEHSFQCPILLDGDVPFIPILTADQPVLGDDVDDKIRKDIEMNPLRLLSYPDLVEKIASRLGRAIGQRAVVSLKEVHAVDPFTRRHVLGYLALGADKTHTQSSNFYMARMMTGTSKIIGSVHLYFAVLWHIVLHTDLVPYLKDEVAEQMNIHMKFRFMNNQTRACLSGNPQFILTALPIDVAIWYLLTSGLFDSEPSRDALRALVFNTNVLLKIMQEFGYTVPVAAVGHIHRLQVMLTSLSLVKKNEAKFRNHVQALYQNAIYIDVAKVTQSNDVLVDYIPLDGPASSAQIHRVMKSYFTHSSFHKVKLPELVGLAELVNPNLAASSIVLRSDWTPPANTAPFAMEWAYGYRDQFKVIEICPQTCRPWYHVNHFDGDIADNVSTSAVAMVTSNGDTESDNASNKRKASELVTWREAAESAYDIPVHKMMSYHRAYSNYFITHKHFPSCESFLVYCYNRYCVHAASPRKSLPYGMMQIWDSIVQSYEPVCSLNLSTDEISSRIKRSMEITKRIKLECGEEAVR